MGYKLSRSVLDRQYDIGRCEYGEPERRKMAWYKNAAMMIR